ncbi:hypothetical protein CERSUDRAFT_112452 [Gelatoporia subvermispora B]|uniref:Uncharacterized protein n=1 Tax=Ceriporiopsis subvermispora (strain B) TaxID=914234 RepID=M2RJS8_CERS8|nr:hypothetical protein CERSUDRAFT_112452 [Gelatoporia subvermispora B]
MACMAREHLSMCTPATRPVVRHLRHEPFERPAKRNVSSLARSISAPTLCPYVLCYPIALRLPASPHAPEALPRVSASSAQHPQSPPAYLAARSVHSGAASQASSSGWTCRPSRTTQWNRPGLYLARTQPTLRRLYFGPTRAGRPHSCRSPEIASFCASVPPGCVLRHATKLSYVRVRTSAVRSVCTPVPAAALPA